MASSGEKAVEMVAETQPNLVLMDIRLKGNIDGIEAAKRIHHSFDVPVVYLTAYTDEATLQRAKVTEPFGYLIKPFEGRELYTTVEMALYKHKMERRLRESERWLATTLRSIGDAVITTDARGSVTFMNPVAVTLTGWQPEDALGIASAEMLKFQDVGTGSLLESPVEKVLRDGLVVGDGSDTVLVARNGRELPVDYNAAPLKDDSGRTSGAVLVFRDMTERKQMEHALLSAERMSAMGYLAATLAHEIKNPMQAIALTLELVVNPRLDKEKQKEYLENVRWEFKRLMVLARDVLSFARSPRKERQPISVAAVVRYALTLAGKQLERCHIEASAHLPDDLPPVLASWDQLAQVFLNLIVNAIEAMPQGGEMVIAAQSFAEEIELTFTDSGPGLSSDVLDKLFAPFFTTKKEGTGMGLSISRSIIREHGGAMVAGNAPAGGAVFAITLPVASSGDV
jgi:PAS domain S-box-containing protein